MTDPRASDVTDADLQLLRDCANDMMLNEAPDTCVELNELADRLERARTAAPSAPSADAMLPRMANLVAEVAISSMVPVRLVKAAAALSAEYDHAATPAPIVSGRGEPVGYLRKSETWVLSDPYDGRACKLLRKEPANNAVPLYAHPAPAPTGDVGEALDCLRSVADEQSGGHWKWAKAILDQWPRPTAPKCQDIKVTMRWEDQEVTGMVNRDWVTQTARELK